MDRLPALQRFRSREEPWIAVDPFRFLHLSSLLLPHRHPHLASNGEPINCRCIHVFHSTTFHAFHVFVFGVSMKQLSGKSEKLAIEIEATRQELATVEALVKQLLVARNEYLRQKLEEKDEAIRELRRELRSAGDSESWYTESEDE